MATDPRRLYSPRLLALFERYLERYVGRQFNGVRVACGGKPPTLDRPTIVYSNHPSWWDPIVLLLAARRLFPGRRLYAPIDAAALDRYRILGRCGLFPIEPGTFRGAAEFMRVARSILREPDALLGLTAQGEFSDVRARPLRLKGGVARLLAEIPDCQAIPLAVEYTFWNERQPEVLLSFGTPERAAGASKSALEARLQNGLERELDRLGILSVRRDATEFETLIDGRRHGVGGAYDCLVALRQRLKGQRFDRAHEAIRRY